MRGLVKPTNLGLLQFFIQWGQSDADWFAPAARCCRSTRHATSGRA